MKHRISAGGIVRVDDCILLVRHCIEGVYDFYVAPGGGVEFQENILDAAVREVKEETGLIVDAIKPVYLEQFYQPGLQHIKTWILCEYVSGDISTSAPEATREHIIDASFFSEIQIRELNKPVYPKIMSNEFWADRRNGFPEFKFLGNHAVNFY